MIELPDGRLRVCKRHFVPVDLGEDLVVGFAFIVAPLLETLEHNSTDPAAAYIQRVAYSDDLPVSEHAAFKQIAHQRAETLVQTVDEWIAEHEADSVGKLLPFASAWRKATQETFLKSYFDAIGDCPSCPKDRAEANRLLNLFALEKALYEICYEATNRPTWLRIPITGLQTVLDSLKPAKGSGHAAA